MAKTIRRKRPQDENQLAKMVVDMAVGNLPNDEDKKPFEIVLEKKGNSCITPCDSLPYPGETLGEKKAKDDPFDAS
jgi:hypothetical protein